MSIEGARELSAELVAIKKGTPKPVYLVFGSESYLVRTASDAIVNALGAASSAEIVRMDAEKKSPAELLAPLTALSLFASARVTVVRNFAHLLVGENGDALVTGVEAGLAPGSALVLIGSAAAESKVDKRGRGYKGLAKLGVALEFGPQTPDTIAAWLRDKAQEAGKKLTPAGAALLLSRAGTEMEVVKAELDKAILYCLDQETIDASDLEKLVGRSREEAVWEIAESVMHRDPRRALGLVEDLLAAGTYPLVLMTLLVRQARHLLQARLLWEEAGRPAFRDIRGFQSRVGGAVEPGRFGKGPDDVTTIHPFASFKRFEAAQRYDVPALRRMVVRVRQGDRDAKSGASSGPREVLEEMILDLCALAREAA